MALLDRMSLLQKALLPLLIMAAVFALTVAIGAIELQKTVEAYRQILAHSVPAVLRLTRLDRATSEIGYSVDRNLVYVCRGRDAADCARTNRDLQNAISAGERSLAEAMTLDPAHSSDYRRFGEAFSALVGPARQAMQAGLTDNNAKAKAIMSPVNDRILALRDQLETYVGQRGAENRASGLALAEKGRATEATMIAASVTAALAGLLAAAWVTIAQLAAPLSRLTQRMTQLAEGDLTVLVEGQGRRDEIGSMARAVQVFKDNARAKAAAEADAKAARERAAETTRQAQADIARVARTLSVGELASSIAHEISQPVAAMVANNQASLRWLKHDPPDFERASAAVERALRDGQRAGAVIQRVRSMIARSEPEPVALDLNLLVDEVLDFAGNEARRAKVAVRKELAPGLPTVSGDPVQLQQVVLNLVVNAIDAMRDKAAGSKLLILKSTADLEAVVVSVEDRGAGFDPETAEQLFQPFFTTKSAGVGLGLAICRTIIETHGGRIWAEPAQPDGARFNFSLPRDR